MSTMDAVTRERLIEEFSACLDEVDAPAQDARAVDLFSLLTEMAALKNEIRIESRQFKGALDEFRSFSDELNTHTRRLERDLEHLQAESANSERRIERTFLLGLLDLRDSLQNGVEAAGRVPSSFLDRLITGPARFAASLAQGQRLTLQRLDDMLSAHGVRPMGAAGNAFDPHSMCVVGVENIDAPPGIVVRETRSGFFHRGEILRIAEVIVSKKDHGL
jgi:molecular chaperone GrpE